MILTQQGLDGTPQNLPADQDQVDTGEMGDCVSMIVAWNLDQASGRYQNVRGFHGSGGVNSIPFDRLFDGVPDAASTLLIACLGTLASASSGSRDPVRAQERHDEYLGASTFRMYQERSRYIVDRRGIVT